MRPEFQEITDKLEPLLVELLTSPKLKLGQLATVPDNGVYVFYEHNEPIYVGRSNRMPKRIREHGAESSKHGAATFALKLLRKKLDDPGGHSPKYARKKIEECFGEQYAEERNRVRKMQFQVIEIKNQRVQYVFEAYAIISLGTTEYNSFVTT